MFERVIAPGAQTGPEAPAAAPGAPEETAQEGQRPEWLDPKFSTPEDLAKAYSELQRQFSQRGPQKPEGTPAATPEAPEKDAAEAAVTEAGLDFSAITAEYEEKGALSDATYQALEKGGIPRALADSYIAGQQAIADRTRAEVFQAVGGEDAYAKVVSWASSALTQAEQDAFNRAVSGGDLAVTKMAVQHLHARYTKANGSAPKLVSAASGAPSGSDVFASVAEMVTAIRDPRYKADSAYRAAIEAKVGRSNVL